MAHTARFLTCGNFTFDRDLQVLAVGRRSIHLTGQAATFLGVLMERQGELVRPPALLAALYPPGARQPGKPGGVLRTVLFQLRRDLRAVRARPLPLTVTRAGVSLPSEADRKLGAALERAA